MAVETAPVEASGVVAMPDEDSDKGLLLFGFLAFARAWGFIPSLS